MHSEQERAGESEKQREEFCRKYTRNHFSKLIEIPSANLWKIWIKRSRDWAKGKKCSFILWFFVLWFFFLYFAKYKINGESHGSVAESCYTSSASSPSSRPLKKSSEMKAGGETLREREQEKEGYPLRPLRDASEDESRECRGIFKPRWEITANTFSVFFSFLGPPWIFSLRQQWFASPLHKIRCSTFHNFYSQSKKKWLIIFEFMSHSS